MLRLEKATQEALALRKNSPPSSSPLTPVSRQNQTWGSFQSLRKRGLPSHITPRRKYVNSTLLEAWRGNANWLSSHRKLVRWDKHIYQQMLVDTNSLLGAGDSAESKTNCLKGAYLPVSVSYREEKKQ